MAAPTRRLLIPLLLATSLAFAEAAFAQAPPPDALGAARDLYASARYDEALALLDDIHTSAGTAPVAERKSIEQYRSLCLLALGRGSEADSAIAAVVTADPAYLPGDAEASPRVRAAFSDVRKRVLPEIAAARYAEAKSSFDRKMFEQAARQFRGVLTLLDDADMGGRLTDLKMLSTGFLDLAAAATAPPPEPAKPPAPAPAPAPPPVPQPDPLKVYTMYDKDVVAPQIVRQDMPRLMPAMTTQANGHGVIEIVINEQGRVEAMTMRQSVQPLYDTQLLLAARDWRYQPAQVNGRPVKYRKLIQINVAR